MAARHHGVMNSGINHEHAIERLFGPLAPPIKGVLFVHHMSRPVAVEFDFMERSPLGIS